MLEKEMPPVPGWPPNIGCGMAPLSLVVVVFVVVLPL